MLLATTTQASSLGEHSRIHLEKGWHYRWGDSPFIDGIPEWTQDDNKIDWLPIQFPSNPPFRDGHNNVWYRYQLPEDQLPGQSLYIYSVDLIMEVYLESEKIYQYGNFAKDGTGRFEGWSCPRPQRQGQMAHPPNCLDRPSSFPSPSNHTSARQAYQPLKLLPLFRLASPVNHAHPIRLTDHPSHP